MTKNKRLSINRAQLYLMLSVFFECKLDGMYIDTYSKKKPGKSFHFHYTDKDGNILPWSKAYRDKDTKVLVKEYQKGEYYADILV